MDRNLTGMTEKYRGEGGTFHSTPSQVRNVVTNSGRNGIDNYVWERKGYIRFRMKREAERTIELVRGRSWEGHRIAAHLLDLDVIKGLDLQTNLHPNLEVTEK